ncbi:hypothetical protein D8B26_002390 [Coccidioides posadasii str. Silveira]|uniref:uncharacterized protein n=1 Tax=Coccidioides posadasii (strain RMSCC 757 / Silveira) TaxID=443226 RepID=UPI001BEF42B2|nr:hypothetical protein D8B26_002390 [Coccidioides posadasii str. Silveira]
MSQLHEHCKPNVLGGVVQHHAIIKLPDDVFTYCLDKIGVMQVSIPLISRQADNYSVTTYSEVRKSYPELEFPRNKTKESGNQATWQAHEIKNHASKTSLAVRMLSGRFRWIVTGTPVHK